MRESKNIHGTEVSRIERARFAALLWVAVSFLVIPLQARGQTLEARFCNITCDGSGPSAECTIGLIGGLSGTALRQEILPLPGDVGVELDRLEVSGFVFDPLRPIGSLEAQFSAPGPGACLAGFDLIRGDIAMPDPFAIEPLSQADIELTSRPMASIGIDLGSQLIGPESDWCAPGFDCFCEGEFCLDVPIPRPDRHYFFFNVEAGLQIRVGAIFLTFPAGVSSTFVLDPRDPFFYIEGSTFGVITPPIPGGGFGFSKDVAIPFVPIVTAGLEDEIIPFTGDYAIKANFDVLEIGDPSNPLVNVRVEATAVISLDPELDGDHPLYTPTNWAESPDLAIGMNGRHNLRFNPFGKRVSGKRKGKAPKKDPKPGRCRKKRGNSTKISRGCQLLSFRADIADASGFLLQGNEDVEFWMSGRLGTDSGELLPPWMPFPVTGGAETTLTARIASYGRENFVEATGAMNIATVNMIGRNKEGVAGDVFSGDALLRVDDDGFTMAGSTSTQLFPTFPHSGLATFEMRVTGQGDADLTLMSDFMVEGYSIQAGKLTLGTSGISLSGTMAIGNTDFEALAKAKGTRTTLTASAQSVFSYSRENTVEKLALLKRLSEQEDLIAIAEAALEVAATGLVGPRQEAENATANLATAENEVMRLEFLTEDLSAEQDALIAARVSQNARNCNADYSGCNSCSSCTSRCDCGPFEFACQLDCGLCQSARGLCLTGREACRLANIATCNADKAMQIASLTVAIAAKEVERVGVNLAMGIALGVLDTVRTVYETIASALIVAEAAVATAQQGLDAALAGAAQIDFLIAQLPEIDADIETTMLVKITTNANGTKRRATVKAMVDGRRTRGRIDLDASPPIVCLTIPRSRRAEMCVPL